MGVNLIFKKRIERRLPYFREKRSVTVQRAEWLLEAIAK